MNKLKSIPADRILSVSAIVIAVVSIVVSVWEGLETRKHNRLSVQPRLEISFNTNRDGFGYSLRNAGLGPAIITDKRIYVDGSEISESGFSGYEKLLKLLGLDDRLNNQGAVGPGVAIESGNEKIILFFTYHDDDDRESLFQTIFQRMAFQIDYTSVYGEPYTARIP